MYSVFQTRTALYILAACLLAGTSFLVFRLLVRHDYLNKGKLSPISYMLELILFALHANMMYIYIPVTWPRLPELPDQPIFNILSRILLYTGLGVVIIAIVRLGIGPTFGQDKNTLRTSGIYAFSRNPQVLGYTLILLALFLCYPSWYAAGWMLLFLVMISLMVHTEEEFLLKRYGAEYRIYCRKAPRYLLI